MADERFDYADMLGLWKKGMRKPATGTWSPAEGVLCLKGAQNMIVAENPEKFPWLNASETITTVASTALYTLTETNILKVMSVTHPNGYKIKFKDKKYIDRNPTMTAASPWAWAHDAAGTNDGKTRIRLIGIPSVAGLEYVANFVKTPPTPVVEPAASVTKFALPVAFTFPCIDLAIHLGLLLSGEEDAAEKHYKSAMRGIRRAGGTLPAAADHRFRVHGFGALMSRYGV